MSRGWLILLILILGFVSGVSIADDITQEFANGKTVRVVLKMPEEPTFNKKIFMASKKPLIDEKNIRRRFEDVVSVEMSLEEFNELGGVKILGIDKPVHAFLQDAVGIVGADDIWELNYSAMKLNGSLNSVCVIDTGVNDSHPDLSGKILAQHCFCSAHERENSSCCSDGTNENDFANDNNGHGTHVAGIIAASGGINGTAVGTNLVVVKVLNSSGVGYSSDVKAAIEWCSNDTQAEAYNISVISLSLGGGQYTNSGDCYDAVDEQSVINIAFEKNISVVVSTGNTDAGHPNATAGISSPACLGNVTRVGASTKSDDYASYGFRNENFSDILFAPGSSINSTWYTGGYGVMSGTSMAAPMVSGLIVMINQYLNLSGQKKTPVEIWNALNSTGTVLDDSTGTGYNFSRVNGYDALLTFDVDAPEISLIFPPDEYVNLTNNQTFFCNVSDWQIANVTFSIWNSSGLYYNESVNLTGTSNSTNFTLTNLAEGDYNWTCEVFDLQGNSNISANFSLTIGGVQMSELYPSNNTYRNINETNFSCRIKSETVHELMNVTFSIWNLTGILIYNVTENLTGINNISNFSYTFLNQSNYTWGCLAYNNASYYDAMNFSIYYDAINPVITDLGSGNPTTSSATISWITNESCNSSLSIGAGSWSNSSEYVLNHSITITGLGTSTTYNYIVLSCDRADNCVNDSGSFSTDAAARVSGGGGGGGGGSVSVTSIEEETKKETPLFYEVDNADLETGSSRELTRGETLRINVSENTSSYLILKEIGQNYINLTIYYDSYFDIKLFVGENVTLDLDSLNNYDLFVKLENISSDIINLTLKRVYISAYVNEDNSVEDNSVEDKDEFYFVVIAFVIFIIFIIWDIHRLNRKEVKKKNLKGSRGKNKKIKT